MPFTKTLDGITTKNPVHHEDGSGWLSIQVPNCSTTPDYCRNYENVVITANYSDLPVLALYRWRFIDGKVVTEMNGQTLTIEHCLLKRPRTEIIAHLNDDPFDCRRVNLGAPRVRPEPLTTDDTPDAKPERQTITAKGADAFLHLDNGMKVTIDRDCIDLVKPYRWFAIKADTTLTFKANGLTPNGKNTSLTLHRLILSNGQHGKPAKKRVTFINGDRTDLRRANLLVELS